MAWLDSASSIAQIVSVLSAFLIFVITLAVKINRKLDAIQSQYRPNGGESMRDSINQLLEQSARMDQHLDTVDRGLANLQGSFDEHSKMHDRLDRRN